MRMTEILGDYVQQNLFISKSYKMILVIFYKYSSFSASGFYVDITVVIIYNLHFSFEWESFHTIIVFFHTLNRQSWP